MTEAEARDLLLWFDGVGMWCKSLRSGSYPLITRQTASVRLQSARHNALNLTSAAFGIPAKTLPSRCRRRVSN
jgi:hypothetical protein